MRLVVDELWLQIFGELDYQTIAQCRSVCSYWREIIETSALLVYKVWLGIHAKADRPCASRHMSVAERLTHLLLDEETGWRTLTFPRRDEFFLSQAQIHIMGYGGTGERTPYGADNVGCVTLGALPFAASSEPFQLREPITFECSASEYTQDPTLDVLIYLCSTEGLPPAFSIRNLSDPSKPHSAAATAVLDTRGLVPDDGRPWGYDKTALVSDKFVIKANSHDLSVLIIWNWMRGQVLVRKELPMLPSFICGGVSIVSSHSFILPILALPKTFEDGVPTAYIEVYEFDDHCSSCTSRASYVPGPNPLCGSALPRHIRTFLLPEMNIPRLSDGGTPVVAFDFYCFCLFHNALSLGADDVSSVSPSKSSSAVLVGGLDRPTEHIDKDRLCRLVLDANTGERGKNHTYDFFVYASTFSKDPVDASDAESERLGNPPKIPWKDWGVANVAAFCSLGSMHDLVEADICWQARGDRVAVVEIDRDWASRRGENDLRRGNRIWQLRVLDFRPERVRRAERVREAEEGKASAPWPYSPPASKDGVIPKVRRSTNDKHATPVGYSGGYFFKEWPMRARLPYVETTLDRKFEALWMDVEMDGEHLIANFGKENDDTVLVEMFSM